MKVMPVLEQSASRPQASLRLKLKSKDTVIHFEEGLIGFSQYKDFVLVENDHTAPLQMLRSVEAPEVGFLVLDPATVISNYGDRIPAREWQSLETANKLSLSTFVIIALGASPETSTGNFQAPLLVSYEKMAGKQIILTIPGLSLRQPLL